MYSTFPTVQVLLFLLFFEIQRSSQEVDLALPTTVDSGPSSPQNHPIRTNVHPSIRNGDRIDLSSYPDSAFKIRLSNSTITNYVSFFQNLEIRYTVHPPKDHGVVVVIQEMRLRRPSTIPGDPPDCTSDYIKFSELSGQKVSGGICGEVYRSQNGSDSVRMTGPRTFTTGIDKGVGVHFFTANGYTNAVQKKGVELLLNRRLGNSAIEIELIFTAYSNDCSGSSNLQKCDSAVQDLCISPNLFCNGDFNCGFRSSTSKESLDEEDARCNRTEWRNPSSPPENFPIVVPVILNAVTSEGPRSTTAGPLRNRTTVFPWWLLQSPSPSPPSSSTERSFFQIPTINWNWNFGYRTPPTTTQGPPILLPNYDYEPDSENVSWAHRLPAIQVILIFLCVVLIMFGTCTLLAKIHTAKPMLFNRARTIRRSRRNERFEPEASLNNSMAGGDVIILSQLSGVHQIPNSPPPRYHEVNEAPPSYNTLFYKK